MRAVVLRSPGPPEGALVCETVPDPAPGPGDVVVQVAACGVCSHDVAVRAGILRAGISLPCIPGHEVAGTVAAVGRDVRRFRPGDRVAAVQRRRVCGGCRYCRTGREPLCAEAEFLGDAGLNGGYAEFVCVEEASLAAVPDDVPLEAAAIAACAIGTMLHAVREVGRVAPGDTVLVTGAGGGLGVHGVQLARRAGGRVIAQTTSPGKAAAIRALGADAVVTAPRGADFSAEVKALTGGAGVDCAIDNVGTPVFTSVRRSLARGARWVLVGQLTGDFVPFNPAQLFLKGISLLSATSTTREELRLSLELLRPGGIQPVLGPAFPLEAAAAAHRAVESGEATGRALLKPGA